MGVALVAITLRLGLVGAMDLSDLPGAAGVDTVFRVYHRTDGDGLHVELLAQLADLSGMAPDQAARALSVGLSLAMVLAAVLGGWAVGGPLAAGCAGLVAATWSLSVFPALLVGPDPLTLGLGWLGVSLCWVSFRRGGRWLALSLLGGVILGIAISLKDLALPLLALLGAGLALAGRPLWQAATAVVLSGATTFGFWKWLGSGELHERARPGEITVDTVTDGVVRLFTMPSKGLAEGLFEYMAIASIAAAVIPGPNWRRRAAVGLAGSLVLVAISTALGDRVRPRYLSAGSLAAIVAIGALAAAAMQALARHYRPMQWLVPASLVALILPDTLAYLDAWDAKRHERIGSARAAIPVPGSPYITRYTMITDHLIRDLTAAGATELVDLADAHEGPLAIVRLRDVRERHLTYAADQAGLVATVLTARKCCDPGQQTCGGDILSELDASGTTLLLPTELHRWRRIDPRDDGFVHDLVYRSLMEGSLTASPDGWWWVRSPSPGPAAAEAPCGGGVFHFHKRAPDKKGAPGKAHPPGKRGKNPR